MKLISPVDWWLNKRNICRSLALAFLILMSSTLVFYQLRGRDLIQTKSRQGLRKLQELEKRVNVIGDKWIVVTSVQHPTDDVIKLSRLPHWNLVVVGDIKTPEDWSLPGVIFLDVQTQQYLGYEIKELLPPNSYTGKAIGYLYAIQHGAKFIYDTDDDNFPSVPLEKSFILKDPDEADIDMMVVDVNTSTYNPYPHFGQSTIWPRGYPLEDIGRYQARTYRMCKMEPPCIQQGLVDGDPDVDAIFRMTRRHSSRLLDLRFDKDAPSIVLPTGTFSPFNSQNTLFTEKAFWALLLPVSVTFRATDIYRGYWAQRLIWLTGGALGFTTSSALHRRNSHSDHKDFLQEIEIYEHIGSMISFLEKWQCEHHLLFKCIRTLIRDLAEENFILETDVKLMDAWLRDLVKVGYKQPELSPSARCDKDGETIAYYPQEQPTSMFNTVNYHVYPGK